MPAINNRFQVRDHLARLFVGAEASFGAGFGATGPAATDGVRFVNAKLENVIPDWAPNEEQTGTRAPKPGERISTSPVPLEITVELIGSGAAGTAPDYGALFKAAAMTETIVGATSVTYTPDLTGATAGEYSAAVAAINTDGSGCDYYAGCRVNEVSFPGVGTALAKALFKLMAPRGSHMTRCRIGAGGVSAIATALPLEAHHGWIHNGCDFFVTLTDGVNSEVVKVTAVSGVTATIVRNVLGAGAFAFLVNDAIKAYVPAAFTTSTVAQIADRSGSLTIDDGTGAIALAFYKGDLVMRTGAELEEKQAFQDYRQEALAEMLGAEPATFTVDHLLTGGAGGAAYLKRLQVDNTDVAVVLTIGAVAGNTIQVTMNDSRVFQVNDPREAKTRRATTIFRAFGDSAPYSVKFT